MFEDFHWDETRAAATARRSTVRRCWSRIRDPHSETSVPDFFKSSSGTRTSPSVLQDIGDDGTDDVPAVHEQVCFP